MWGTRASASLMHTCWCTHADAHILMHTCCIPLFQCHWAAGLPPAPPASCSDPTLGPSGPAASGAPHSLWRCSGPSHPDHKWTGAAVKTHKHTLRIGFWVREHTYSCSGVAVPPPYTDFFPSSWLLQLRNAFSALLGQKERFFFLLINNWCKS